MTVPSGCVKTWATEACNLLVSCLSVTIDCSRDQKIVNAAAAGRDPDLISHWLRLFRPITGAFIP